MSSTPEELLELDSREAVYRMGQDTLDVHHPGTLASWYKITPPLVDGNGMCEVTFTLEKILTPVEHWTALKDFTIRYPLIDIASVCPTGTEVIGLVPSDSIKIIRSALSIYNIPVRDDEFSFQSILNEGSLTVTVNSSYRWKGSSQLNYIKKKLSVEDLIQRHNVVTNFSPLYSSMTIRDDIIDHLNRFNKYRLPRLLNKGDIRFCLPTNVGSISEKNNTQIRLVAIEGDYTGEGIVYYKRRSYQPTWRVPVELPRSNYTDVVGLLPDLSAKLECIITATDVVNASITPDAEDVIIQFAMNSLGYVGFIKVKFI